jgi:hypothetical protein
MSNQRQIITGTLTILLAGTLVWVAAGIWKRRKVIARRLAQTKRLPPPPGTATPQGQRVSTFLASLTKDQKSQILKALTLWQKWTLAALDENNPIEIWEFWQELDPMQRDVVRDALNATQKAALQSVLREGEKQKHGTITPKR